MSHDNIGFHVDVHDNVRERPPSYGNDTKVIELSSLNEPRAETPSPEEEDYSLLGYFKKYDIYRNTIGKYKSSQKAKVWQRRILKSVLALLVLVYLVLVLFHLDLDQDDIFCSGGGFFLSIAIVGGLGRAYFTLWKPLVWKKIKPNVKQVLCSVKSRLEDLSEKIPFLKGLAFTCVGVIVISFLIWDTQGETERLISAFGIVVFLLFGFIFSAAPFKVAWRQVIWGMSLQFILGLLILRWPVGEIVFDCLSKKVETFLRFSDNGASFLFGFLATGTKEPKLDAVFAFSVLPVVIFFSLFVNVLYYYGVMQWLVMKVGWLLQVTIGTTPCESMNAAANIFLGMTEAPLLIKPYLPIMTKSELHTVMTGGFATIAGSVLAAYISFGVDSSHLMSASVMSAPAALAFSKLFYPETEKSKTNIKDIPTIKATECNALHAALEGVSAAIPLVANIAANLLAFISLIAFVDSALDASCQAINIDQGVCTMSNAFGYIFKPIAFIMGVPWEDCYNVGQLIGTKTIINEFVAYDKLGDLKKSNALSRRAEIIATYALCGFSNVGAIGIQLGGLGAMAPCRKRDLANLATRAMIAGTMACFLTACVAGTLISSKPITMLDVNTTLV